SIYSAITLYEGGYSNILIAIDQNVSDNNSLEIITAIQKAFKKCSELLYQTTGLYFRSVTILIPNHWKLDMDQQQAHTENIQEAAIHVGSEGIYDSQPWTVQPGGCGEPGLYIHLTPQLLLGKACHWSKLPIDNLLVRE
ncbi:unnamed protein product, partial [Meganyctiphanes norvegica]